MKENGTRLSFAVTLYLLGCVVLSSLSDEANRGEVLLHSGQLGAQISCDAGSWEGGPRMPNTLFDILCLAPTLNANAFAECSKHASTVVQSERSFRKDLGTVADLASFLKNTEAERFDTYFCITLPPPLQKPMRFVFRCLQCERLCGGSPEKCSQSLTGSPKVRLRKFASEPDSHELFPDEMGSNRTGEVNSNVYSEDRVSITKRSVSPAQRNGTVATSRSSQSPEYVKRTAKLFEKVQTSERERGGESKAFGSESSAFAIATEMRKSEKDGVRIALDCLDGECNKKPSYLGVSCSNSGYRNVINYDSKLREGFWSANRQRESLVLASSRLRESSPLRSGLTLGPRGKESLRVADVRAEKRSPGAVNGVSRPEEFVNISTSTKTISTFRNRKDLKEDQFEDGINGNAGHGAESKVTLKQILNGKNSEPYLKGYSNLGFSPKILKSPEKNCNSFLKSISSFENNCKKSQTGKNQEPSRTGQRVCDSSSSIQQRIERLYGPGALAQGFYAQKPHLKTFDSGIARESPTDGNNEISLEKQVQLPTASPGESALPNSSSPPEESGSEAAAASTTGTTEPATANGRAAPGGRSPEAEPGERDGHHFLRLLKKETDRLDQLATFAETELENGENLPEEVSGKLRAAAGKARLLVCQKLHQFEGLCHKNLSEKPGEQFPTTGEDLAGFWDMVMLQVVQVHGVFEELEQLKKNNWKAAPTERESPPTRATPRKATPTSATPGKHNLKSDPAKNAREEGRRKMLEERRRKMKELKENKIIGAEGEVEIFAK